MRLLKTAYGSVEDMLKVLGDSVVLHNAWLAEKWENKAKVTKSKHLKKRLMSKANKYHRRERKRRDFLEKIYGLPRETD